MIVLAKGRAGERALVDTLNTNLADLEDDHIVLRIEEVDENTTFVVPAGYRLSSVDVINTTANAVTGGISLGTAAAGTDVVAATAVGANAIVHTTVAKKLFAAEQTVHVSAVTAWNSASLTLIVMLDQTQD